jgi:tRNA(Ile)-lysidine synthase
MPGNIRERVLAYVRQQGLLQAGDRLGLAVSGGADSVALLRLMLELRGELGIFLSVIHFNHRIRGAEADADEQSVRELAEGFGVEFYCSSGDVPAHAAAQGLSIETAARELRYRYFFELLREGKVTRIATAHTLDDQAETVLLRLVRGTGTRGLAGIYPELRVASCELRDNTPALRAVQDGAPGLERNEALGGFQLATGNWQLTTPTVVRPLLEVRRSEIEEYLRGLGQGWREDATNQDVKYLRNRVRHVLLPLLEREFNPAIRQVLAEMAEIARAEEEYWKGALKSVTTEDTEEHSQIQVEVLRDQPLAVQRRIIRAQAERLGISLEFEQVEKVLALSSAPAGTVLELPGGWVAERKYHCVSGTPDCVSKDVSHHGQAVVSRVPVIVLRRVPAPAGPYEYHLRVPGEVRVPELGLLVRTSVVCLPDGPRSYNQNQLLDPHSLPSDLRLRNWRPGDRYWPAHSKSVRKVKELLQTRHISGPERSLWPVVVNPAGELVWMRGFAPPERFAPSPDAREAILIEVLDGNMGGSSQ